YFRPATSVSDRLVRLLIVAVALVAFAVKRARPAVFWNQPTMLPAALTGPITPAATRQIGLSTTPTNSGPPIRAPPLFAEPARTRNCSLPLLSLKMVLPPPFGTTFISTVASPPEDAMVGPTVVIDAVIVMPLT